MELPRTQYARSGDVTIAYHEWGSGPPIVWVPGFCSHVELNWESPFFARAYARGGEFAHMATFDKRGTGLSDHQVSFGSFEERVHDIVAVFDAMGLEHSSLGGMSEGGPLAILFAAMYPERVERLVLFATFARYSAAPDYPIGNDGPAQMADLIEQRWGTGEVLRNFAQDPPDPETELQVMSRIERYTATPQQAAHIMRSIGDIDVRDALGSVQAPTLVLHSTGDPIVPVAMGRYLAEHIPTCERFVEWDRAFHASWSPEVTDLFVDEIERFITGQITSTPATSERVMATILFTDIVDSTARAEGLGDAAWREVLDRHDQMCADEVAGRGGRIVKTTGDGILAVFDGPARGVRGAQRIIERANDLGLDVRAGLHVGECERRGDDVTGIAVNLAARIMHDADDNQLLVSSTVKDLSLGSELVFEPAGHRRFKGIPDEMAVYTVA